jgi:hypothetical protein
LMETVLAALEIDNDCKLISSMSFIRFYIG